ncbi:Chondroitin sulfate proteoglycan 4 [Hypsibius exemplaris]|uniref:Chondroitin sulfate proteoglycan 4 n=1 Tax=Hypsibius exemplaris TaxID=2072580 RepID=A0A1W0W9D5_HYPEX|nr:Chondroitin sulfate proteoglycan 4 [Hypsibius exemplaris]
MAFVRNSSFYGDSYLWLALQDASSATELTINFRTHQRDAIVLLAAGETDYCLVELRNGRLRVRVNLGSGESVLQSPRGLRLDDNVWHTVQLSRRNAQATLTVDRQYVSHLIIPGVFYQLNIIYGVYLGGLGNFRDLFLGNFQQFRGCLKNVKFNTIEANRVRNWDILRTAYLNQTTNPEDAALQHIRWECDDEFSAKNHDPISFVQPENFLTFPTLQIRQNGTIELEIKTVATDGLVLYNGGSPTQPDFLALDIFQGRIRLQVEKGNGPLLLQSERLINDGEWHNISCQVTTAHAQLTVDGQLVALSPRSSMKRYLDLDGSLYVGGVESTRKTRLRQQGLHDRSYLGCIKDIRINEVDMGFEKILVSNGIEPGCVWDYPCSKTPCIPSAACHQVGLDSFRCECPEAKCERDREDMIDWTQVLRVNNFTVKEGGQLVVSQENIRVLWNYQGESIRDSQIVFQINRPPRHGKLEVNLVPRNSDNSFTYLDILSDRVLYIHDGSERPVDQLDLTMLIPTTMGNLSRHFVMIVNVNPENDAPKIVFPNGPQIEIVPGTARTLTADIMRAVDPDSSSSILNFTLLAPLKVSQLRWTAVAGETPPQTFSHNGAAIPSAQQQQSPSLLKQFTQADIDGGLVEIYFNGSLTDQDQAIFSVSDGISSGKEKGTISIIPLKLNIHAVANKSINVPINSSSLITQNNLSFATNAIHQNLTIGYTVIHQPSFGRLEQLYNNTHWTATDTFTQDDINTLAVRYVHLRQQPSRDAFRIRLSILPSPSNGMASKYDQVHTVHIRFLRNNLKTTHLEPLIFHTPHVIISSVSLLHEQEPIPIGPEQVIYSLVRPPKYGLMQRGGARIALDELFSQADVNAGLVVYSLDNTQNPNVPHRDFAVMDVFFGSEKKARLRGRRLVLKYEPVRSPWVLRDSALKVKEGGNVALSSEALSIQHGGVNQSCVFTLASYPEFGILQTRDRRNISEFSTRELNEQLVFYTHDNSESETDAMDVIVACPGRQPKLMFPLLVNVTLTNNHPPAPIHLGPIFLVQNASRLLTDNDVQLTDADVDSQSESLTFAHRGLANADLFHISDRTLPINQCIQSDITQGHVIIRHRGPLQAESNVFISDGDLFTTEKLNIQAEPLLLNVKDEVVAPLIPGGPSLEFTLQDLNLNTNADLKWNPLTMTIQKGPKFGTASVRNQTVIYRRKDEAGEPALETFVIQFSLNNFTTHTVMSLVPYKPIKTDKLEPILVRENSAAVITTSNLNSLHPVWEAARLSYTIIIPPTLGSISVGPAASADGFTQEDVNQGKVKYVHRVAGKLFKDQVTVRVEAPFSSENLTVTVMILIVPEVLRLNVAKPLKVNEGGAAKLKLGSLIKGIPNAEVLPVKLQLKDKPGHGKVFVDKEGSLVYTHDGSESLHDVFTVFVNLDKLSISTTEEIHLDIVPINDHAPQVITKNPLDVWVGTSAVLTGDNLEVLDEDSDYDFSSVVYHVNTTDADITLDHQPSLSFSALQLANGHVRYSPKHNNVSGLAVFVSDGKLVSEMAVLPVRVLDLRLSVARNETIEVGRNSSLVITADELDVMGKRFSLKDEQEVGGVIFKGADLVFDIIQEPKFGFMGLFSDAEGLGSLVRTKTFTQKHLQDGRLGYMQSIPITDAQSTDSFRFDVTLKRPQERRLSNLTYFINIKSFDSSFRSHPLLVPFGRSVLVKRAHLDATPFVAKGEWKKIRYTISTAPKLGSFFLDSIQLKAGGTFSQTDINKQRLSYQHLGKESQTPYDDVVFKLLVPDKKPLVVTLNVTIVESDTHLKVTSQDADVVSGENLTMSQSVLKSTLDNKPSKTVRYRVFKDIVGGEFRLRESPTKDFTQRDVLDGVVMFAHDGSDNLRTIPVQLEILPAEGSVMAEVVQFNIHVIQFFFRLDHHSNITLAQGNFTAPLNASYISVASNADKNRIIYQVTREPQYGRLRHINISRPGSLKVFTQADIDKRQIVYEQTLLEGSEDYFTLDITLKNREDYGPIRNKTIHISVQPLSKMEQVIIPVGQAIPLSVAVLDASALKLRAKNEPTFQVIRAPVLGSLVWAGEKGDPVTSFTHTDIVEKKVIYKSPAEISGPDMVTYDSFDFLLTAGSKVQVAKGTLMIKLRSLHQHPTKIVTNDHVLIALVICGIIFAAVVTFIIMCLRMKRNEKRRKRSVSQHAHLSPLFQPKGRTGDSPDEGVLANSTVPSCKVIPMKRSGKNFRSPETEMHHLDAYREDLYGSANGNGYVSRSETTPVLRKDQYWV